MYVCMYECMYYLAKKKTKNKKKKPDKTMHRIAEHSHLRTRKHGKYEPKVLVLPSEAHLENN